ncbi:hypothetical protein BC831DRAFT_446540, partial [Entophlyctis helioformis]
MSQQLLRSRMVLSVPVGPIATATAESASPMAASPLPSPPVSPAPCASRLYSPTSPAVRSTLAMSAAPLLHRLPNDLHALVAGSHCVSTPPASFDASSLLAAILNKDMLLGRPGNDNNDDSDSNDSDDSDVYAAAIDTLTAQLQSQSLPSHPSTPTLHLLFGYGSLINPASRRRTFSKDTIGIPVAVRGFQRSWSYACPRRQYTAVAVERVAGRLPITNGVLIPVPEPHIDLPRLDDRERNYSRGVIDLDDVQFLSPRVKQRPAASRTQRHHMGLRDFPTLDAGGLPPCGRCASGSCSSRQCTKAGVIAQHIHAPLRVTVAHGRWRNDGLQYPTHPRYPPRFCWRHGIPAAPAAAGRVQLATQAVQTHPDPAELRRLHSGRMPALWIR